jgi:hypothetical protein
MRVLRKINIISLDISFLWALTLTCCSYATVSGNKSPMWSIEVPINIEYLDEDPGEFSQLEIYFYGHGCPSKREKAKKDSMCHPTPKFYCGTLSCVHITSQNFRPIWLSLTFLKMLFEFFVFFQQGGPLRKIFKIFNSKFSCSIY